MTDAETLREAITEAGDCMGVSEKERKSIGRKKQERFAALDALVAQAEEWRQRYVLTEQQWRKDWERAEAAEEKLDDAMRDVGIWQDSSGAYCERMLAAEADNTRLREALTMALDCTGSYNRTVSECGGEPAICTKCEEAVRAALATDRTEAQP